VVALRPDIGGGLSAHVVADDLWPHRLAALALLLLAVGVTRAERGRAVTVSVVVPTRNSMRTLAACLRSIRAQDVPVELIVVDNASTDGTYELARELADTAVRGGPERSAQRNAGVRLATAGWILWIDADMVLPPTTVSAALATATRDGADAVAVPEVSVGTGYWTACRALERPATSTTRACTTRGCCAGSCCSATARSTRRWPDRRTPTCGCGCGRPAPGPRSARTC
jgi:hypothetical protein